MDELTRGLIISLLGVVITFLALGSLVLLIWLLRALYPSVRRGEKLAGSTPEQPTADMDREVAVIAAAWYWWDREAHRERAEDLGSGLARAPGPWWRAGAVQEESSR